MIKNNEIKIQIRTSDIQNYNRYQIKKYINISEDASICLNQLESQNYKF